MDALIVIAAVFLALGLVGFGVMAWRIFYRNEEMESGGSLGRQVFERDRRAD
jgi:hypothetical protein